MLPRSVTFILVTFQFASGVEDCQSSECNYGKKIFDFGCRKTNQKCGTNMEFKTISKIRFMDSLANYYYKCIHICVCVSDKYVVKGGQCVEKRNVLSQINLSETKNNKSDQQSNTLEGNDSTSHWEIQNNKNDQQSNTSQGNGSRSRWEIQTFRDHISTIDSNYLRANVTFDNATYDLKFACSLLLGYKCGINMIFKEFQPSSLSGSFTSINETCWKRCECENDKYVRRGEECVKTQQVPLKADKSAVQRGISLPSGIVDCRYSECNYGGKIVDYGCHRTNEKCGTNMEYRTVSKTLFMDNIVARYKCMQKCVCVGNNYFLKNGQCFNYETLLSHGNLNETKYSNSENEENNQELNRAEGNHSARQKEAQTTVSIGDRAPATSESNLLRGSDDFNDVSTTYNLKFICSILLGYKCGINMIFKEIQPSSLSENSTSNNEICWIRCECESEKYTKIGNECVEIQQQTTVKIVETIRSEQENPVVKNHELCKGSPCVLNKIFTESCNSENKSCGKNMKRVIIYRYPSLWEPYIDGCKMQCKCSEGFQEKEKEGTCILVSS